MRISTLPIVRGLTGHLINYPTPANISYMWGFGSCAGLLLVLQIVTGVFLALFYIPSVQTAFSSVEEIMRSIPGGWFVRNVHANSASLFFIVLYAHFARGLLTAAYNKPAIWFSGFLLFNMAVIIAFLGYVLPWGQMSFWGATVITNILTAIPYGEEMLLFLYGGYVLGDVALRRFFVLHFLLPFVMCGIIAVHLLLLHSRGSSAWLANPQYDYTRFYPPFYQKDRVVFVLALVVLCVLACFFPTLLNHPDNAIPANPLSTPAHIVPEWYFLPFYGVLRVIPHKVLGIVLLVMFFIVLVACSAIARRGIEQHGAFLVGTAAMFIAVILLGWVGARVPSRTTMGVGHIALTIYFSYFFFLLPYLSLKVGAYAGTASSQGCCARNATSTPAATKRTRRAYVVQPRPIAKSLWMIPATTTTSQNQYLRTPTRC